MTETIESFSPHSLHIYVCGFFFSPQISLSVTEELHIVYFDTLFQHKGLDVALQVTTFPVHGYLNKNVIAFVPGGIVFTSCFPCDKCRPAPSRWSSSLTPASSRVPGHLSSGST